MSRLSVRIVFVFLLIYISAEASGSANLKGTYKCSGYNISGAGYNVTGIGGSCHFSAPLILKPNGTYYMVPEHGRYKVTGDQIFLSESKFRGPGKIRSDGAMITFDYEHTDKHYFITYTCEDCAVTEPPHTSPEAYTEKKIRVDLLLHFKKETGLFSWVNQAYLVPQAHAEKYFRNKVRKDYVLLGTSRQITRNVVSVGFQSVDTGKKYVVFLDSYGALYPVAMLDLTRAHKSMEIDLNASLSMDLKSLKSSAGTPAAKSSGEAKSVENHEAGMSGGKAPESEQGRQPKQLPEHSR